VLHMARGDYLFVESDSFTVQDHQRRAMQAEVASMDGNRLLNTNIDDLASYFADKFGVEVPELLEAEKNVDQREAQRDVSGDPNRVFFYGHDRGGPFMMTGTEITVDVPFSGDPAMFKVRPNTYNSSPPRASVRGNILTFNIWGENLIAERVGQQITAFVAEVNQWLEWQRNSFNGFNDALAREARQAIDQRRAKLLQNQNLVANLGIPLKHRPRRARHLRSTRSETQTGS
jgi:hypothetical protein